MSTPSYLLDRDDLALVEIGHLVRADVRKGSKHTSFLKFSPRRSGVEWRSLDSGAEITTQALLRFPLRTYVPRAEREEQ